MGSAGRVRFPLSTPSLTPALSQGERGGTALDDLAELASRPSELMEGAVPGMVARQVSVDREDPDFFDNSAHLYVLRGDLRFLKNWETSAEGRLLRLPDFYTRIHAHHQHIDSAVAIPGDRWWSTGALQRCFTLRA